MPQAMPFPKYRTGELFEFVADLRTMRFIHLIDAANYFHVHHTSIARYENSTRPPFGYLACLAMEIVEKFESDGEELRSTALVELNRVIHSEYFREEVPFRDWESLCRTAREYLAERQNGQSTQHHAKVEEHPASSPIAPSSASLVPHTLFMAPPLPVQGIVGREETIEKIIESAKLLDETARDVPPIALRGMGGVGKTTLAIAVARDESIRRLYPDGVLWAALGPHPTVRLLLEDWGKALGLDLLPARDEATCQEALRSELFQRQALIIVDDVWNVKQGEYFLVGGPGCRTLLTTRESDIAYNLVTKRQTIGVNVLKPEPAFELLARLVPEIGSVNRKIANNLCQHLEYLPLGLTLAGKLLAIEADVPYRMQRIVDELIERGDSRLALLQQEGRLGISEDQPVSLRAILGMSVERLNKTDQDRFAMLSNFGGEPLTWEVEPVSNVWECSLEEAEATISRLIQRGIVEKRGDRYWMHALLADYADELRNERNL